ncbi:hypothetical protein OG847_09720 [Streptomyces sp. NBC_00120]|nr:hypothetical protein [Streptomyces sp. NBC_00120]
MTEAKLGEMRVDTSCRPAVVPAWLFTLEGYDSPSSRLQQVTVKLDRPIGDRILLDAITGKPVAFKPLHGPSPGWS